MPFPPQESFSSSKGSLMPPFQFMPDRFPNLQFPLMHPLPMVDTLGASVKGHTAVLSSALQANKNPPKQDSGSNDESSHPMRRLGMDLDSGSLHSKKLALGLNSLQTHRQEP